MIADQQGNENSLVAQRYREIPSRQTEVSDGMGSHVLHYPRVKWT